jgi:hypothetical protein
MMMDLCEDMNEERIVPETGKRNEDGDYFL